MNAATFFSREIFHSIRQDIADQKLLGIFETPYKKTVKVKGNVYELTITTGQYLFGNHDYFVSLWNSYSYTKDGRREIGGSAGAGVNLDSYESFCDRINQSLKRYPDYTEPTETHEQLCLFW